VESGEPVARSLSATDAVGGGWELGEQSTLRAYSVLPIITKAPWCANTWGDDQAEIGGLAGKVYYRAADGPWASFRMRARSSNLLKTSERFLPTDHPNIRTVQGNLQGVERVK
jgi:hypothetical protein